MKRFSYLPLALLIGSLFFLMSLSKPFQAKLRSFAVGSLAPTYEQLSNVRHLLLKTVFLFKKPAHENVEKKQLILENELLKAQSRGIYEWLTFDQRIDEQIERLKAIEKSPSDKLYWKSFFQRRSEELRKILEIELQAVPAKIVFRDPTAWNSQLWINIGEELNETLGHKVIGLNSPVVVGDAVVGVVEYVGQKFSRLRLITDANLSLSARAIRGSDADRALAVQCKTLKETLETREGLIDQGDKELFFTLLQELQAKLQEKKADYYLAKGEVHGAVTPHFRSSSRSLVGVGFNYDFADNEGPSRELKTGKTLDGSLNFLNQPLLKKGDLLITTGFDGVFPAGLKVGTITEVGDLSDASYSYEIKASPAVSDLVDLSVVFVMPSLDFIPLEH